MFVAGSAHAQAGTAVKEASKATAEVAWQGVESVKGAMTTEPNGIEHKARAKHHGRMVKASAKEAVR